MRRLAVALLLAACRRQPAPADPPPPIESAEPEIAPVETAGPPARAASDLAPGAPVPPTIRNADRVVALLRPRFKQCYQRGLAADPLMEGRTVIQVLVQPDGHVAWTKVLEDTGLSDEVIACLERVIGTATFEPPRMMATLNIPVSFVNRDPKNGR